MPAFFIGGGRDDVDGGLLGRLYGALLLEYDAKDEIGAVLPYRLVPCLSSLAVSMMCASWLGGL